jgi:tripartite-type tricarboxylate transporter receptor subunit TctC
MIRLALAFVTFLSLAHPLHAEPGYPQTTIRIVLGFSPGSAPDVAARILAERFKAAWGKPVVVENMLGAGGGNVAADHVAKAAPDGATLLMAGNAAIVINPSLYAKLPYDPARDLVPIAHVTMRRTFWC